MQRGRFTVSRNRWVLGVAVAAAAALAVAGCSSGSSSTSSTSSASTAATSLASASGAASPAVSPDTAFYQGKTVTLIIPSKPGGTYDKWGRLLAIYMGQYLHATIKATNVGAADTIIGQNALAAAPPNGLTFGMLDLGNDVELKALGQTGLLKFDPVTDTEIVGAVPPGLTTLFVQASSPYKTIADLQNATEELKAVIQTTASSTLTLKTILGAYGIKAKYIAGYTATSDQVAGFIRGDGVMTMTSYAALLDNFKDGKSRAIVEMAAPPSNSSIYPLVKDVPTLGQLIKDNPPATAEGKEALTVLMDTVTMGQIIATPKGVAPGQVAALTAALTASLQQPDMIAQILKEGLNTGDATPPDVVKANMTTAFDNATVLAPYAKGEG